MLRLCTFPAVHVELEISHVHHYISIRGKCIWSIMASIRQSAAGKKDRNGKPLTNQELMSVYRKKDRGKEDYSTRISSSLSQYMDVNGAYSARFPLSVMVTGEERHCTKKENY